MEDIFSGGVNPRQAAQFLQNPSRLASVLQQQAPGWDATPAEIVCDIVNVQRADTKALADAHDVDIEMKLMDESRAAELIAGVTDGDAVEIIEVFNELARKRNEILLQVLDEEQYREFMRRKTSIMHTDDPDTWEVDLDEPDLAKPEWQEPAEGIDDVGDIQDALSETSRKKGNSDGSEDAADE